MRGGAGGVPPHSNLDFFALAIFTCGTYMLDHPPMKILDLPQQPTLYTWNKTKILSFDLSLKMM